MCTVLVSIDPASAVPVLLVGVRDEFTARPWRAPGPYWPDHPGLLGGQDLQAGGTWLAVDPARQSAACVLNGFGVHVAEEGRRSRGDLPLGAPLDDLAHYDPFHLLRATATGVHLWSWDGVELVDRELTAGLHIVVNTGLEGIGQESFAPEVAAADMAARLAYFRPRLAAARRPEPVAGDTASAWGEWLPLTSGDRLAREDPRALLVRREFPEARLWGSSSISLVALRPGGVRYDFAAVPPENSTFIWQRVV
jgi:hypothetical protein